MASGTDKTEKKPEGIVDTIKTVVYALLIAGVFRTLFFQPFWIPSASMKDTLLIGDFLFVNKMAYGYSRMSCPFSICPISGRILGQLPERGDVVVFRHPVSGEDYIKRLIGLPGDRVKVEGGILSINDVVAPQEPAGIFTETWERQGPMGSYPKCMGRGGEGLPCEKERFVETLPGGVKHNVLNTLTTELDDTKVFVVPEGHFFFMGDNRDDSTDSRVDQSRGGVGMVPFENLIGRADRIMFSSAGRRLLFFWTWRSDRFFKRID